MRDKLRRDRGALLFAHRTAVAGAVLNAVDLNRTSYSYYYQQYYYYRREGYRALDTETERDSAAAQDAAPPPN